MVSDLENIAGFVIALVLILVVIILPILFLVRRSQKKIWENAELQRKKSLEHVEIIQQKSAEFTEAQRQRSKEYLEEQHQTVQANIEAQREQMRKWREKSLAGYREVFAEHAEKVRKNSEAMISLLTEIRDLLRNKP